MNRLYPHNWDWMDKKVHRNLENVLKQINGVRSFTKSGVPYISFSFKDSEYRIVWFGAQRTYKVFYGVPQKRENCKTVKDILTFLERRR